MIISAESFLKRIEPGHFMHAASILSEELGGGRRSGGVLLVAVAHRKSSEVDVASMSIGEPDIAKVGGYAKNAAEKFQRLLERRLQGTSETASSQSADPSNPEPRLRTYGGCTVGLFPTKDLEVYMSFSGAPAETDEVCTYVSLEQMGFQMDPEYKNPQLPRARELLEQVAA